MIDLLAMAFAAATVTPATPLSPSGKWTVDYQKDMCLVSRPFGTGNAPTVFAIKPSVSMESGGQTLFVLAPATGAGVHRGKASVTIQPSGVERKFDYVSWIPKGTPFRGYEVPVDADFVALMGESSSIGVTAGKESFAFATGKVQPVLNALKTCNENLFRSWGVDPAALAAIPKGIEPGSWFPPNSYPVGAKQRGATGRLVIALTVAADGRPSNCRVVIKADRDLDDATCRLGMRNARFDAVPGKADRYAIFAVRWELWDF